MSENIPPAGQTILQTTRQQYISDLSDFRWQVYQGFKGADDHERVANSIDKYTGAFREHLGSIAIGPTQEAQAATMGSLTTEEITLRREILQATVDKNPPTLYPEFEFVIGGNAFLSAVINLTQGHYPSAVGSTVLAATSYASYKYRNSADLTYTITDNPLTTLMLNQKTIEHADAELCMAVFSATIDSEKIAALQVATKALRARTYTPLGFARQAAYTWRQNRSNKKAKKLM